MPTTKVNQFHSASLQQVELDETKFDKYKSFKISNGRLEKLKGDPHVARCAPSNS